MAGLDPAIHASDVGDQGPPAQLVGMTTTLPNEPGANGMDGRVKPGHDARK
jgi:hypothetical protein